MPATLDPRRAESVAQGFFDFLVPVTKELLRTDEVMKILRKEKDAVYELGEIGELEPHQREARSAHITYTRRSVIAYLAKTARYQPEDFLDTVFHLAAKLPASQRQALIKRLQNL